MKFAGWLALVVLLLVGGCARMPGTGLTSLRAVDLPDLERQLIKRPQDLDGFRLRGPFSVDVHRNLDLRLSGPETFNADLYLAKIPDRAPLVILLHGLDNSKNDHAYQAMHLATWGMHALVLQVPGQGPWVQNGRILARVAEAVQRQPELAGGRVDVKRIVLAGHSYGGAATAIALAEGAPAVGGILLDPASFGRELPAFLKRVNKPVMLIGADQRYAGTQGRALFYSLIPRGIAEVSVRDAVHEDGEFPMEPGAGSPATETHQITFVGALTVSAFSLAFTGGLDYAWTSFGPDFRNGKLINGARK